LDIVSPTIAALVSLPGPYCLPTTTATKPARRLIHFQIFSKSKMLSGLTRLFFVLSTFLSVIAAPAQLEASSPTPQNSARVSSPTTEEALFETVYWPYSVVSNSESKIPDNLLPVASVFSLVASTSYASLTSIVSPLTATTISAPVSAAPTNAQATTRIKATNHKVIAGVIGAIAGVILIVGVCLLVSRHRRCSRRKDFLKRRAWFMEGGPALGRDIGDEKRARESWWNDKVADVSVGDSLRDSENAPADGFSSSAVDTGMADACSAKETPSWSTGGQGRIRRSVSSPLLASPSPIRFSTRRISFASITLDQDELLASLDADRYSSASTSSSFATAETHPVWVPVTGTRTDVGVHRRTKSVPDVRELAGSDGWI
jgi:hypothetical protein